MTKRTPAELLDWLERNLFLSPEQVAALRATIDTFTDERTLAKELLQRDWLTAYQINQILQGRGEQLLLGPNRLLERIGEGGMGQVFRAWNTRLGRVVAVKTIHKEHLASPKAMERFRREVAAASQLDHPNIGLVRDADEFERQPFLVMDYIEGIDLSRRLKAHGPLPINEAVEFVRQAALGLHHAFERGIIHRDIKPGNLIVTPGVNGAVVKVVDFGLARFHGDEPEAQRLTQAGNLIGTVDYMAPEQAVDARVADVRADIYSLGCTLYTLLTGRPAFEGNTLVEKLTARRNSEPPSVRAVRPEIPAGLDTVVRRMMAREPADRYETPADVAQALAPFTRVAPEEQTVTASLDAAELWGAMPGPPVAQPISNQDPTATYAPALLPDEVAAETSNQWNAESADEAPMFGSADAEGSLISAAGLSATRAVPRPQTAAGASGKLYLYAAVGVCVAAVAAVGFFLLRGPGNAATANKGHSADARLEIMPMAPVEFKDGGIKKVIVQVHRHQFRGPVRVFFEDLPDLITSEEIVIPQGKEIAEISLNVRYGIGALQRELTLRATADNLTATEKLPIRVTTANAP